ncbi:colicin E5-related ribonuclease [Acinetobacter nosocomialis]|uniref:colicin E5-related ribonuclease n=1 Tax=Acinetobacter nosocomialis TaxID=106654 RepID=UPI001C06B8D6|nr:colicin E5-related ribonuclease [Acinetobacter nosocomialis]MDB9695438.1 colicin E5-related ribonuclease [Acinetobacter nosocomialis]MDP7777327.1 colicin E5-related ribonuclease [Acinetobacter nosocomialis]
MNGAVAVAEAVLIGKVGAKLSGSEAKVSSSVTSKLNPTFTIDPKIENQMSTRGWSNKDITDVMKKGPVGYTIDKRRASKTPDNLPRNDTATVYGSKNGYVVVNDRTKEVVQISDKTDKNWIPDSRIQWK